MKNINRAGGGRGLPGLGRGRGFGRGRGDGPGRGSGGGGHGNVGVRRHQTRLRQKSKKLLAMLEKSKNNCEKYMEVVKKLSKFSKIIVTTVDQVEMVANLMADEDYGGKLAIPSYCSKDVKKELKKTATDLGIPKEQIVKM